jgi:hypothetical protein
MGVSLQPPGTRHKQCMGVRNLKGRCPSLAERGRAWYNAGRKQPNTTGRTRGLGGPKAYGRYTIAHDISCLCESRTRGAHGRRAARHLSLLSTTLGKRRGRRRGRRRWIVVRPHSPCRAAALAHTNRPLRRRTREHAARERANVVDGRAVGGEVIDEGVKRPVIVTVVPAAHTVTQWQRRERRQ